MNKPEHKISTAELATELSAALHKYSEEKSPIRWLNLKSQIQQSISRLREIASREADK